jgi:hypothetical protein
MVNKTPLNPQRIRKITGSFAFIEHRFLRDDFFTNLTQHELILYVFLILVSDRNGISYYSYDRICTLLRISLDEYLFARNALIKKDLIAFNGDVFQVLSLPEKHKEKNTNPVIEKSEMAQKDPATIRKIIRETMGEYHDR